MKNRRNHYRILRVQPDAPAEIIHAAYRVLMRDLKLHPDLGGSEAEAALVNKAYEVLRDPALRSAYDEKLVAHYSKRMQSQNKRPLASLVCPLCKNPMARRPQPGEKCMTCLSPLQSERPSSQTGAARRTLVRTQKEEKIQYYSSWPGKPKQARMLDFSPQGMRLLCSEMLPPRTMLKITCSLFEASAAVTNVQDQSRNGQKLYTIGLRFLAISYAGSTGNFMSTSA